MRSLWGRFARFRAVLVHFSQVIESLEMKNQQLASGMQFAL
jgi:hypothetical protein